MNSAMEKKYRTRLLVARIRFAVGAVLISAVVGLIIALLERGFYWPAASFSGLLVYAGWQFMSAWTALENVNKILQEPADD